MINRFDQTWKDQHPRRDYAAGALAAITVLCFLAAFL